MPTPKRWHPVSRDLNQDPELWAFTNRFGDRYLRLWLEVVALIDQHDNAWRLTGDWVGTLSRKVRGSVKNCSAAIGWMLEKEWLIVLERSADGSPLVLSTRNFWKFHKRREPSRAAQAPDGRTVNTVDMAPSYPNLSDPNLHGEKEIQERTEGKEGIGEVVRGGKGRRGDGDDGLEPMSELLPRTEQELRKKHPHLARTS